MPISSRARKGELVVVDVVLVGLYLRTTGHIDEYTTDEEATEPTSRSPWLVLGAEPELSRRLPDRFPVWTGNGSSLNS